MQSITDKNNFIKYLYCAFGHIAYTYVCTVTIYKHHIGLLTGILIIFFALLYSIHLTETQLLAETSVPVAFPYKNIALTFDDGPYGNSTQQVLDILKNNDVKATFFIVGKNAEHYPSQVIAEVADGHIIGNHSYNHAHLGHVPLSQLKNNLQQAERVIQSLTGLRPHLFRAPYGDTSPSAIKEIQHEGYVVVGWTVDPNDWNDNKMSSDAIIQYVITHARQNSIVLLHDGRDTQVNYSRDNMIGALPQIIIRLKQHGYRFVTADKILNQKPYY